MFNTGATYQMHGISSPVDVSFPSGNPSNFAGTSLDWIFGASPASSEDKETYGQFDGIYQMNQGAFTNLKFGVRAARAQARNSPGEQGPNFAGPDPFAPANLPMWNGETYPGNFASGLGGNFPRNVWQLSPSELERWGDLYSNRDPVTRRDWSAEFALKEKVGAAYVMSEPRRPGLERQHRYPVRADQGARAGQRGAAQLPSRFSDVSGRAQRDHDVRLRIVLPDAGRAYLQRCPAERELQVGFEPRSGRTLCDRAYDGAAGLQRARRIDLRRRHDPHRQRRQPGPEADPLDQRRRGPRVVLPAEVAAVGGSFLHGPEQLRRLRRPPGDAAQHQDRNVRHVPDLVAESTAAAR